MDGGADGHAVRGLVTDDRTFHNLLRRTIASIMGVRYRFIQDERGFVLRGRFDRT
jgi:hypothetical protein